MDEKTAKEIAKQLKRIADAMEAKNKRETIAEKRKAKLESLQVREIRQSKTDNE
tara:strand:+ start:322 stop:483 length:162 start_codon:yes stop_codon:yes gene_type:complete